MNTLTTIGVAAPPLICVVAIRSLLLIYNCLFLNTYNRIHKLLTVVKEHATDNQSYVYAWFQIMRLWFPYMETDQL